MCRQAKIRRAVCVAAGLGVLLGGGEAVAQSDGVTVDPETPAGKEYALPLDRAREDVAPDAGAGKSPSQETPLFGAGITKRSGAPGDENGGQSRGENGDAESRGSDSGGSGQAGGGVDARGVARAAAASGSGVSPGWLTALIAGGVLLVGGIVGFSLRALRATDRG